MAGKSGPLAGVTPPLAVTSAKPGPQGIIEFWIQRAWNVVPHSSGPLGSLEHTLLNIGPVRPDHLYLSTHSSLTIV